MIKVLIDTPTLRGLLDQHPEAEAQILTVAAEKIAHQMLRKFKSQVEAEAVQRFSQVALATSFQDGLNARADAVVQKAMEEHLGTAVKALLDQHLEQMLPPIVEKRVQGIITQTQRAVNGVVETADSWRRRYTEEIRLAVQTTAKNAVASLIEASTERSVAEQTVRDIAAALGCSPDLEDILQTLKSLKAGGTA